MNILHIIYRAHKETESTPNLTMEFTQRLHESTYVFSLRKPRQSKGVYSLIHLPLGKTLIFAFIPFLIKHFQFAIHYVLTRKTRNLLWLLTNIINLVRYSFLKNFIISKKINLVNIFFGDIGELFVGLKKIVPVKICVSFHGHDASMVFMKRYQALHQYCDAYYVLCEFNKNDLIQGGFDASKIHVVKTGLDFSTMPIHQKVDKKDQIIYVGRLTPKKAIFDAIKAFHQVNQHFPEITLLVIGDGPLFSRAQKLVEKKQLTNKVIFQGHLPPSLVYQNMLASLIFFLPSKVPANGSREGTPCAVIEAQALGLPIVATKHAGIPEIVIEGKTALLNAEGDINGLVKSLCALLKDRTLCHRFSDQAQEYALHSYPIEKRAHRLLHLYKNL